MIRMRPGCMRVCVALALLAGGLLIGGCGNSGVDSSTVPSASTAPPPIAPQSATPAPVPVTFDQLTLESKVTKKTDANGLVFYLFSYADRDGKVYKCELPAAMAQGQKTPDAWIRVFDTHRLSNTAVKAKPIKSDANKDGLSDFPFIAPKPYTPPANSPSGGPQSQPTTPMQPPPAAPGQPAPMPRGP